MFLFATSLHSDFAANQLVSGFFGFILETQPPEREARHSPACGDEAKNVDLVTRTNMSHVHVQGVMLRYRAIFKSPSVASVVVLPTLHAAPRCLF